MPRSDPRVVRQPLGCDLAPVEALRLVRADAYPVALFGTWADGADVIGSEPVLVRSPPCSLGDVLDSPVPPGDASGRAGNAGALGAGLTEPTLPAFGGGWIGYLGFGHASEVLPVPPAPGGPRRLPTWWFGWYDHVLRRDRSTGRWFFEALWTAGREEALEHRFEELARRARAAPPARGYRCSEFLLTPSAAEHKAAVGRAVDYIWRGDIFQANICLRLEASFDGDPLDAFCEAAAVLRPPYAAFIRMPGGAVASLSPELFLRRNDRAVVTRPIKGTHRRSARRPQAARQRAELERSAKDRAENVMIVDLMRNDLSRVCAAGSVQVPRLLAAEPHPGVWHLVSEVRGTLRPPAGDGDLIRAAFPPGSVTGAPKVRALEIIHELEATPREIYTGAVGYRSPLAGLELNVAIRTFEFCAGRVWLGSGGGIVADSAADAEYAECLLKAGPLIRALGGRGRVGPPTPADRRFLRPRPAAGVFTSLLVTGGDTRGLASHLARLDASARQLFGKGLPPALPESLEAALTQNPTGRLRITVQPAGGPLRALVEVVPLDRPPAQVSLRPAVIEGGLGAHKWRDRRLLADLSASMALQPGEQLLIEDANGDVLETDRANLFAVIGGILHTPPADGRLLPGVARAAVLRAAHLAGLGVSVAPISRAQLLAASEVFVTNAVHGARSVRSLAGSPAAWPAGPVASRMAAALTRQPPRRGAPATTHPPIGTRRAAHQRPRPGPARPVVLIDNYDSFTFNLAHMLTACGCSVEVVRNDEVTAEQVTSLGPAGVVISPGPRTPADAGISVDVVRACTGQVPLLGICLGHQAIATAFGARIVPAPRPVHGQTSAITHDGRGVLAGLPQPFQATRYHSLIVDQQTLPPNLNVTAVAEGRIPMGLRHATQPTEGVQFHPESILTSCGQTIIRNFAQAIRRRTVTGPAWPDRAAESRLYGSSRLRCSGRRRVRPTSYWRRAAPMNTTPSSALHVTSTTAADGTSRARAAGRRALVLGGGGSAGNAWEIGVIAGLFDAGLDVTEADLVIGTSAGSTAAAQISGATQPAELLASILAAAPRQRTGPAGSGHGPVPDGPAADQLEKTGGIIAAAEDAADMRRRMGAAALEMDAAPGSSGQTQRRAAVAARLPSRRWPQRPILIVAVDAHTGEPVVFDRHSGVDLVDAVTASCAGPGVPPHSIGGNRYIDGGYRSNENADLAAGYERVLVLSPLGGRSRVPLDWGTHLAAQVAELRARGSRVETIFPDSSSGNAFGVNLMDPSTRPPAARAGYNQGRALAEQLTEFWR